MNKNTKKTQWKKIEKKEKKKRNMNTVEYSIKKERKKRTFFFEKKTVHWLNKWKIEHLFKLCAL